MPKPLLGKAGAAEAAGPVVVLSLVFVVLGLIAWVDLSRLSGMIALVLSVLGIGVTVALELPTTWRVWRGDALPTGGVYVGEPGKMS